MTLLNIPTNFDAIKVIEAHTDDLYLVLKEFLRTFNEGDRQLLICMFAELEFDYTKN